MRELRKDIDLMLESSKEELDNADEMKIEDVLIGLKGLKQEEVFSFLGKNNFTPAETEMSSSGFSGYDQLPSVDSAEMEQLQLSFNAHFDGLQGSNGHTILQNSYISKSGNSDLKFKIKCESGSTSKSTAKHFVNFSKSNSETFYDWPLKKDRYEDTSQQQRIPSMWPKYSGTHEYVLPDYHMENFREEEIIATSMGEELISSCDVKKEDEFKYASCNSYVIQSSVDGADIPDKPKPIKLRIKRVEGEDEVSSKLRNTETPATRTKSKRIWGSSVKHKTDVLSSRKRKCFETTSYKSKVKNDVVPSVNKNEESLEELDFPFSNTVHQDDDFVYPSFDMSDDEDDDIYSFSQRDDETWTPKIKMKINEVKTERPIRNRKRNAVAKCLEAAALKRADTDNLEETSASKQPVKFSKKITRNISKVNFKTGSLSDQIIADDRHEYLYNDFNFSKSSVDDTYSQPSTSDTSFTTQSPSYCIPTEFSSSSELSIVSSDSSVSSPTIARRGRKAKVKSGPQSNRLGAKSDAKRSRLIPPKTCKLIQTPQGSVTANISQNSGSKFVKNDGSSSSSPSHPVCTNNADKKLSTSPYITKRGKPKKGMATAKQRLGKILKMHKMFF